MLRGSKNQLRNPLQEKTLSRESPLRRYLLGKPETSYANSMVRSSLYARFRCGIDRNAPVALVFPPTSFSVGSIKRVIPPLGLLYLSAALKKYGFKTVVTDCVALAPLQEHQHPNGLVVVGLCIDEAARKILFSNPSSVCISVLYSCDLESSISLARELRRRGFVGPIIFGGLHVSMYPLDVLTTMSGGTQKFPDVDFVIRGEGEQRLPDLLNSLTSGIFDLHADGVCGFDGERVFLNEQVHVIEKLDELPFPDYESIDLELYFSINLPFSPFPKGKRVMQILSSRGCPIGCTFCASTNFNRMYRVRSVENVVQEIEYLKKTYHIDEIQFADDNLTLNRKRARDLFDAIACFKLNWCTPNGVMVNTLDNDLAASMVRSGMYQITLSFDGGANSTLKNIHRKPVNLRGGYEIAKSLQDMDVLVHTTLVIGMPGETTDDISEAFAFFQTLPVHSVAVFFAQALPGSELYDRLVDSGRISPIDARKIDTANPMEGVSDISTSLLIKIADDFIREFNAAARTKYPEAWSRKYGNHLERMKIWATGNMLSQNFRHTFDLR